MRVGVLLGCIGIVSTLKGVGVMFGVYWDTGKYRRNYYLGFRVFGSGLMV